MQTQLTIKQRRVLGALQQANKPLGAYALLAELRGSGFSAPTQIYRALDRLVQLGLVRRIASLNAYVLRNNRQGQAGALVFAVCDRCGGIDEVVDAALLEDLARTARRCDFAIGEAAFEIHGTCARCRQAIGLSPAATLPITDSAVAHLPHPNPSHES